MLRVGLIGAGFIGQMHARNLAAHAAIELAGIFDVDAEAARKVARATGSSAAASVAELLAEPALDAVLVASSTPTHCDLIEAAAKAGKAVLCEKPIDLDMARVDACAQVVRATGTPVQIGFNRRFDPSHAALHTAVASGEIGRVEQVVISSRDPAPPPLGYVRVSGGLFRDMMIHDFDLARFVFGEEPREVYATGSVLIEPGIGEAGDVDAAMAVLRMESGALCHINCSRRCAYGYDQRVEAFGEGGMLVSTNPTETSLERHTAGVTGARDRMHHFFVERYAEAYVRELDAFVKAVENGESPSPGFDDGRRALLLADAATESAATGRTVAVGP